MSARLHLSIIQTKWNPIICCKKVKAGKNVSCNCEHSSHIAHTPYAAILTQLCKKQLTEHFGHVNFGADFISFHLLWFPAAGNCCRQLSYQKARIEHTKYAKAPFPSFFSGPFSAVWRQSPALQLLIIIFIACVSFMLYAKSFLIGVLCFYCAQDLKLLVRMA